jgi:hypothetical protein
MPIYAIEIRNNTNIRLYKNFVSYAFDNLFPQSIEPQHVERIIVTIVDVGNQDILLGYRSEAQKDVGFNGEGRFQNGILINYGLTNLPKNQILGIRGEIDELQADQQVVGGLAFTLDYM